MRAQLEQDVAPVKKPVRYGSKKPKQKQQQQQQQQEEEERQESTEQQGITMSMLFVTHILPEYCLFIYFFDILFWHLTPTPC